MVLLRGSDLRLEVLHGKGNDFERFPSKQVLPLNVWTYVCVVAEPRKLKLFINGALDSQQATPGNTRAPLYPVIIGACPTGVRTRVEHLSCGFDGLVGSFNHHTRALSPAYVRYIYEQGPPSDCDTREAWSYRLLTALHLTLLRTTSSPYSTPRPQCELALGLLLRADTGRVRHLASEVLALLLERYEFDDLSLTKTDLKMNTLGLSAAETSSLMRMESLGEMQSLQKRAVLFFLRIAGCCWEPSLLNALDLRPGELNTSILWGNCLVDKSLADFLAYTPVFICTAAQSACLGIAHKGEENLVASALELSSVIVGLLQRLGRNTAWNGVISTVVSLISDTTSLHTASGGNGWRAMPLVEALGISVLLGARPAATLGAAVTSTYSGGSCRLITVNKVSGQVVLLGPSSEDCGPKVLVHGLNGVKPVAMSPLRLNEVATMAVVRLLQAIEPFAAVAVSDLFCLKSAHHAYVKTALRSVRPLELFFFEHLLNFIADQSLSPEIYESHLLPMLQMSFRAMSAPDSDSTEEKMQQLWVRVSSTTISSLSAHPEPAADSQSDCRQLQDFLAKVLQLSVDCRTPEQTRLLHAGLFSELAINQVSVLSTETALLPPCIERIRIARWELDGQHLADLFTLTKHLRQLLIATSRRLLHRALSSPLLARLDPAWRTLSCQVTTLRSKVDGISSHSESAKSLLTECGPGLPVTLRYLALSMIRPADQSRHSSLSEDDILKNTDLLSRQTLTAHVWLDGVVDDLEPVINLLRVLLPALSFIKNASSELQLSALCARAVEFLSARVLEGWTMSQPLADLAKSAVYSQLRRRVQEALVEERGLAQYRLSTVTRSLARVVTGLELLQRRSLNIEGPENDQSREVPLVTGAPRMVCIGPSSVELDLVTCCMELASSTAFYVELCIGVEVPGEDVDFETVYRGTAPRITEAGLAACCTYSVRARLHLGNGRALDWSAVTSFSTAAGTPFTFDASRCGPDISLVQGGLSARYTGDDAWSTVLGSTSFSSGVTSWEVRIVQSSTAYIFVGVAKSFSDLNTFLGGDENGWGFIGEQALYHSREKVQVYGESFCKGDVVGCHLDLNVGTLSFSRNGKTLGVGFTNVYGELFPAVAFYNAGQEVELLPDAFRTSSPQEPIHVSPSRLRLDDMGLLTEMLGCLSSRSALPPHLLEAVRESCVAWSSGGQLRRRAASGRHMLILKTEPLLEAHSLRHADRVRTPFGLASVAGVAHGRIWLQMGSTGSEHEVWFFSRAQLLLGQEAGYFSRVSYAYEVQTQPTAEMNFPFEVEGFYDLLHPSRWTRSMDLELSHFLWSLADSASHSVWDVTPDDVHREFRALQTNLIRLVMCDHQLSTAWGIKGPSRRAVVARCSLLRYLNHLVEGNLAIIADQEEHDIIGEASMSEESLPMIASIQVNSGPEVGTRPLANVDGDQFRFSWSSIPCRYPASPSVAEMRGLVFLEAKTAHFTELLMRSGIKAGKTDDEYDYPEDLPQVKLNRFKSFRALESEAGCGEEQVFASMFCQLRHELRAYPRERLRISYTHPMDDGQTRAFKVRFEGEGVDDYGGPYRDVFQCVCEELQRIGGNGNCVLPMLIPTRNWGVPECVEQYKYTFRPAYCSTAALELFRFMGEFVGLALRSKITLDLALPSFIWKRVVSEPLTDADLASFDQPFMAFVCLLADLDRRRRAGDTAVEPEITELLQDLNWTVCISGGTIIELVVGGAQRRVSLDDLPIFLDLAAAARLNENARAVDAFKEGLLAVVPAGAVSLLTGQELEALVCGSREIDVARLQANTEYDDDVSADDPHVLLFWEVLADFSAEERSSFLRFVWARPTLPPKGVAFPQKMRVQSVGEDGPLPTDAYLPKAHTCFFSINLPRYSSKNIMADKLRYAVANCTEMDADYKVSETEDVAGWNVLRTLVSM
jgi:hypothetical protein